MESKETRPVPASTTTIDSITKTPITQTKIVTKTFYVVNSVENPKKSLIVALDQQIKDLRDIKMRYDDRIVKLREEVEQQAKANTGFLYELKLMAGILRQSPPALVVWLLWFLLLLGIEIFILVNKLSHLETDYDVKIQHHMELQKRKLKLLGMQTPAI